MAAHSFKRIEAEDIKLVGYLFLVFLPVSSVSLLICRSHGSKRDTGYNQQPIEDSRAIHQAIPFAFKGLFICGECGRSITAEKKVKKSGREYIYYRCTKFETNCSQKPVNETIIESQIADSLQGLKMPEKVVSYVAMGLKTSLTTKRATADKTKRNFEEEKKLLEERLDNLYEDKLDGNIAKEFYKRKSDEYSTRIKDLDEKISKMTHASLDYYDFGSKILELASKASFLYEKAHPEERKELLSYLLSNSTLKDRKALLQYKKPFDRVLERASCSDWRGRRDIITNNFSPKVLTGLLNMSARFEVMRERMERVMAQ